MSFPLYDTLSNEIENEEDIEFKKKEKLMKDIKSLDNKGHETIYALIKVFKIQNDESTSTLTIPYEGKNIKAGIKFEFDKLPIKLKYMLLKFVELHIKNMEENKSRLNEKNNNS